MRGRSRTGGRPVKMRTSKTVRRRCAPKEGRGPSASAAQEIARLTRELNEAREQQIATGDVLKAISRSTFDLQAVLDTLVKSAARLCEADMVGLNRPRDGAMHFVANFGLPREFAEIAKRTPFVPGRGTVVGRVLLAGKPVQIADVEAYPEYTFTEGQRVAGFHTLLGVPLERGGEIIGVIVLIRTKVRPFTDKQIELAQNFAAQAVIAIENTRLLHELRQRTDDLSESLEQQTATTEVLRIISSTPGELAPVFDAMLSNATRLCEAKFGILMLCEGDAFHMGALHNVPPALADLLSRGPVRPGPNISFARAAQTRQPVQYADVTKEQAYLERNPLAIAAVDFGSYRTILSVPMLKEGEPIGVITMFRQEVRPFGNKQIELVQNFAAQAVIAIENARLLNELRESLGRQTATADILRVIASTPEDSKRALDTIADTAARMFDASNVLFRRIEGEVLPVVATAGPSVAKVREALPEVPIQPSDPAGRCFLDDRQITIEDRRVALTSEPAEIARIVRDLPIRSQAFTPLSRQGNAIGVMVVSRSEVRPFKQDELDLMKGFADQAVIAIENARLLNELRQRTADLGEALEQQTATSEVLRLISSSQGELEPVFQNLLSNATRLCAADFGLMGQYDGDSFQLMAQVGADQDYVGYMQRGPFRPGPETLSGRVLRARGPVQIEDFAKSKGYLDRDPLVVVAVEQGGVRTTLGVPMLRENDVIGMISLYRQEVRLFTDKQIELLQNFAAQAVIAIENVRLLNELRESLQQQTATADVLRVISSSPTNVQPVFDSIAESAVRLCGGQFSFVVRFDGKVMNFASCFGLTAEGLDVFRSLFPRPASDDTVSGRALLQRTIVEIADVEADAAYGAQPQRLARTVNYRSIVGVPLLHEGNPIGAIAVARAHAGSFPERQIALLQAFADQAVIAIRNVRLFDEVQARTEDLTESLQQQTATAEVLKVISRSTFDLQTVLNTLIESAARLCDADQGTISRQIEGEFYRSATYGHSSEFSNYLHASPVDLDRSSVAGRALVEGRVVHIEDIKSDPEYTFSAGLEIGEFRTAIGVPMMREGVPIGVLALTRKDVRRFTEKQIDLAITFADQAAIAIENVRLFEAEQQRRDELVRSLEELRTAQDRLVQTQKLASLGQLTAGIAHEIKNPLNFVNNFSGVSVELINELEGTLQAVTADERTRSEFTELMETLRGNLDKIVQHGKRADSIVKNMLLHSREGSGEHRPVDINLVLEESLNLAYHGARAERQGFNITLERSFDPAAGEVDLFPQEITRVFLNLISNGFYAATKRKNQIADGTHEPTLAAATKNLGDRVEIRIRDNGTGIPPEVKERMFNPFFTTKPAGEGTGLGLSISHDIIVKQHAGTIEVDTRPGEFTEFRIVLPRTAALIAKTGGRA